MVWARKAFWKNPHGQVEKQNAEVDIYEEVVFMKKWFKKTVAVVLTAAMAMTVGTPVFAAETRSLTEGELAWEYNLIEEMQSVQVPTLMDADMQNGVTTYSIMDLTRSSSTLWQQTYNNNYGFTHNLSCSWLLNDSSNKYMNIFLVNSGQTDVKVTIMKDSALGNVNALAETPVTIPAGSQRLFTIDSNEFIDRISNNMVYGELYVKCANLELEPFSVTARAVFYKE